MSSSSTSCIFESIRDEKSVECITEIEGLASDSRSPTDTWILHMKPGTVIREGSRLINITNAFFKFFINPESWMYFADKLKGLGGLQHKENYINSLQALQYENRVYNQIITPIINSNQSPHFIRSFIMNNDCTFHDLIDILNIGYDDPDIVDNVDTNLRRNLIYLFYNLPNRPSIDDDNFTIFSSPIYKEAAKNFDNLRFNYTLNQAVDPDFSKTFMQILYTMTNIDTTTQNLDKLYICLFQIVQACYAMYKNKVAHNDLHWKNIWVTQRPTVFLNLHYNIDGKDYYFTDISIMCRVFDFDRSYCETLGDNPYLTRSAAKVGIMNKVVQGKDLVKVLCIIFSSGLHPTVKAGILELFTSNVPYWNEKFIEFENCIIREFSEDKLYDYPQILDNLYSKISSKGKKDSEIYTDYVL